MQPSYVPLLKQVKICNNFVGNEFRSTKTYQEVRSPWTGAEIGKVAWSTAEDVETAVNTAAKAYPPWRQTPIKERTQILLRFREQVLARLDEIAGVAALEAGKTVAEARAGILKGLEVAEFAASLQNLDSGAAMDVSRGVTCEFRREPLGVVVGIVPFNFPAMVPLWMYPIALTLGNCFILKPSEKVPLTSQWMAECMREAGYPSGVFQILNGGREVVEGLIAHSDVQAVGFVGSTAVAKSIYLLTTSLGKRALCLGGAKNQLLVVPDADEAITVRGVVDSFTGCAGQRCMAASVLIAVGQVDHLIDRIVESATSLTLGKDMGAIIDPAAVARIQNAVKQAEQDGAKILLDGRRATPPLGYEQGCWIGPTIIDQVKPTMACAKDEIFGPVLSIIRVKNLTEAMAIEAQNHYGNATSVFTTSGVVARMVSDQATSGMVGVNIGVPVPREPFSFGGSKQSKFGACDITGESSLEFWSTRKKITTKWAEQSDATWMS